MKKLLLETSFSKIYIIVMILISVLVVGSYFSYAMFTVTKEKSNAISIVTCSLTYKLEVDGEESNILSIPANSTKDFIVTLSNPNNRIARFNFYYKGDISNNIYLGYVEEGYYKTPDKEGINLEKNGTSGSSNIYLIRISNYINNSFTLTLGVEVGLDYNDLTIPSNGHLFEEYIFPTAVQIVKNKSNSEGLEYDSATEDQKKEAWVHSHPKTEQTEALTDYRYVGKNPNNYVKFNNEIWRIIGVFTVDDGTGKKEERLKIIRDESLGNLSWDNKDTTTGAEGEFGKNNWPDARLNYLLNEGHSSKSIGGSLYWERKSGKCYTGYANATINCNFTSIGLKEEARNMIDNAIWYLGASKAYLEVNAAQFYEKERGVNVYSSKRDISWIGKVGLMYPSDYGYATSGGSSTNRSTCLNTSLYKYNEKSDCYSNDWLYNGDKQWTLTPGPYQSFHGFIITEGGRDDYYGVSNFFGIRPVVYLKSNIIIIDGAGSSDNPYVLQI